METLNRWIDYQSNSKIKMMKYLEQQQLEGINNF